MRIESMQDLLLGEVAKMYTAETRAVEVYPQRIDAASSPELKQALSEGFTA